MCNRLSYLFLVSILAIMNLAAKLGNHSPRLMSHLLYSALHSLFVSHISSPSLNRTIESAALFRKFLQKYEHILARLE